MDEITQLHALADGELDSEATRSLNARLANDARLSDEYERIVRLKSFVQRHAETCQSEESWIACVGRLKEIDRTRRVDSFVGRYAWGLCSVIFCSIVVGGWLQRNNSSNVSGTEVAGMMSSFTPERVGNATSAEERKWVQGIFNSADSSLQKIFVGRVVEGYTADGRFQRRYDLRDAEGPMVLDVISGIKNVDGMTVHGADDRYKSGRMGEATTVAWIKDGTGVFLTAKRDAPSLVEIAKRICPSE